MGTSTSFRLSLLLLSALFLSACSSGPGITSSGGGGLPACVISEPGGWQPVGSNLLVLVGTEFDHADIRYTLDSTVPVRTSSRYSGWGIPIRIDSGSHVVLTVRAWSSTDSTPWTRARYFN